MSLTLGLGLVLPQRGISLEISFGAEAADVRFLEVY